MEKLGAESEIVQKINRWNESITTDREKTLKYHTFFDVFPLGRSLANAVFSDIPQSPMLVINNDHCVLQFKLDREYADIPLVATFKKWKHDQHTDDDGTWWQFVDLKVDGQGAGVNLMSAIIAFTYVGQIGSATELNVVADGPEFTSNIKTWVQQPYMYSEYVARGTRTPVYASVRKQSEQKRSEQKRTVDEAFKEEFLQKRQRMQGIMEAMQTTVQPQGNA